MLNNQLRPTISILVCTRQKETKLTFLWTTQKIAISDARGKDFSGLDSVTYHSADKKFVQVSKGEIWKPSEENLNLKRG